ncbi:SDR family oxidoreductase [Actinobacteria bacterium YIM 96077]|uniref:SDR family oxidoreductase n=1 Tax=Phytoactinopolyspora halophila TaxID=1981511 RepID=A0A329QCN3_9ACTN|nr:SDR family oxidoreductase [Phytoactinopolyspora halophila]AYY13945.1 SDR family oxidoreductase [Actinobacteria bacterium YIM 96077]RAW10074.1 SDR family oxidoreductase [Phytoactinopolyspora halophila]
MTTRDMEGLGVLVTGAAGDIGAAMGREFAQRGAHVTAVDIKDPDSAAPWLDSIRAVGEATYVEADVRDRHAVAAALAGVENLYAVIGNAGIGGSAPFLEVSEQFWSDTLAINLTGCFNVGQLAAQELVSRGRGGRIVFTGSWVQDIPWPEITAYSVAKAGVQMLARQMALELADHGILVNVVAPGIVDAGLAKQLKDTDPGYAQRIKRVIPLGDLQTPEHVARATAFLCAPDNDYMTGSVLLADGGCSLHKVD